MLAGAVSWWSCPRRCWVWLVGLIGGAGVPGLCTFRTSANPRFQVWRSWLPAVSRGRFSFCSLSIAQFVLSVNRYFQINLIQNRLCAILFRVCFGVSFPYTSSQHAAAGHIQPGRSAPGLLLGGAGGIQPERLPGVRAESTQQDKRPFSLALPKISQKSKKAFPKSPEKQKRECFKIQVTKVLTNKTMCAILSVEGVDTHGRQS